MRLVILESPYAGNTEAHTAYALDCLRDCLARNESPLASHVLLTQVLDDHIPSDRALGIHAGHAWIPVADALVVYTDHGISPGMQRGIARAKSSDVTVEYRSLVA